MTVIALTQEMGSLAKDVAEKVAADLGLQVMRHEVVDHVSSRMHVPTSLINRLREGKAGAIERLRADRTSLAVYVTEELLEVDGIEAVDIDLPTGAVTLTSAGPVERAAVAGLSRDEERAIRTWLAGIAGG